MLPLYQPLHNIALRGKHRHNKNTSVTAQELSDMSASDEQVTEEQPDPIKGKQVEDVSQTSLFWEDVSQTRLFWPLVPFLWPLLVKASLTF